METMMKIVQPAAGLIIGAVIGYSFGLIQNAARRRHERKMRLGQYKTPWTEMPGSGVRVAYLLVLLVLIQFVCPMLFADGTQWWVSGGVAAGYGTILFRSLRQRIPLAG